MNEQLGVAGISRRPAGRLQPSVVQTQTLLAGRQTPPSYHDVEHLLLEPGPLGEGAGVHLGRGVPLELGLQGVATPAIGQEAALVQVHLLAGGLKVESH